MAAAEVPERVILQLRAVLRGVSPLIWRRLLVPSDASIAQEPRPRDRFVGAVANERGQQILRPGIELAKPTIPDRSRC
jgi:hypothetical protein